MKKLIITILACTFVFSLNAQTTVSGPHVSGIWTAFESPYMIHGNITVHTDSLLSIEPNVQIIFQDEYLFTINGNLQAIGLNGDSIRFTVQDTTGFYNNTHTGWNGLYFYNSTSSSKLDFCIVEYSKSHGIFGEHSNFDIDNSAIRFNNQNGITILNSGLDLENSIITENDGDGLHLDYFAQLTATNTTTENNQGNGLYLGNSDDVLLTNFYTDNNNGAGIFSTSYSDVTFHSGSASNNQGIGISLDAYSLNNSLRDVTIQGNNGRGIYCAATSTLYGVNLLIDNNTAYDGGGIYCENNCVIVLDSVTISNNEADTFYGKGGGIYSSNSYLTLTNSSIFGGDASQGGGIYHSGGTISILNSTIDNCHARNYGGGLCVSNSILNITNLSISLCWTNGTGGGASLSSSDINVNNLDISNCNYSEWAAGLSISGCQNCNLVGLKIQNSYAIEVGGLIASSSTINIDSSEFVNNEGAALGGGGIRSVNSSLNLKNTLFENNDSDIGGAIYLINSDLILEKSILMKNTTSLGGAGIYQSDLNSTISITNSTFIENENIAEPGSVVYTQPSTSQVFIKNSIVWNNSEPWISGEPNIPITYCNIQSGSYGPTNISMDPLFVDPLNDDYHLSWTGFPLNDATKSPCIDSGDPTSPLDPDGTQIDMGAFSFDHYQYSASISSILDVPNDQGKRLVINWNRSHLDNIDSMKITHYKIWRLQNWAETPWEYIGETPAHYFDEYSFIATTINDSTANGIPYYTYLISSETENPFIFYNSLPDSGYSVDNIAPEPPDEVYGYQENNSVQLFWNPSIDEDFDYFSIYRNLNSKNLEFEIIATVTDTFFIDQNISGDTLYYNITATDLNDNESEHSDIYQITNSRTLDLKLFLEGPFFVSQMISYLNLGGHLPLSQPYNNNPWNYDGMETVEQIPNNEIIDWILLEFRDAADSLSANEATSIYKTAAFVKEDGTIVDLDGVNQLKVALSFENNLYLMIWHRNHLPTMSSFPLNDVDGHFTYNFSNSANKIFGGANYHKQLSPGIWGFMAADGNADGQIDNKDKNNIWIYEFYNIGYKSGDFNMDGQVNFEDKLLWGINAGRGCLTTD